MKDQGCIVEKLEIQVRSQMLCKDLWEMALSFKYSMLKQCLKLI